MIHSKSKIPFKFTSKVDIITSDRLAYLQRFKDRLARFCDFVKRPEIYVMLSAANR